MGIVLAALVLVGKGSFLSVDETAQAEQLVGSTYGNWGAVALAAAFFSAFVLGFLRTPRRRDWRHLGMAEAYLVALFTEMFGTPLTIYLLSSVLGVRIGLGPLEGHLWATLLDRLGILPLEQGVEVVMSVSAVLILAGLIMMGTGWWKIWRAGGRLVTGGIYRLMRHPQYTGFMLIIAAFFIQWPTLPTVVMLPILTVMYYRLARREELELEGRFGGEYRSYKTGVSMFLPVPLTLNLRRRLLP